MIKIIGFYKGRREVIDWTMDRQEAHQLHAEYVMAYGPDWKIESKEMSGHQTQEEIIAGRRQGLPNSEIARKLQLDLHTIEVYSQRLADEGIIDRRQAGSRATKTDRNQEIAQARRDGLTVQQIADQFGLGYFNVRGILYQLRKKGQL